MGMSEEDTSKKYAILIFIIYDFKKVWSIQKKLPLMWHLYLMIVRTTKTPSDAIVPNIDNTNEAVPKTDVGFLLIVIAQEKLSKPKQIV